MVINQFNLIKQNLAQLLFKDQVIIQNLYIS